MGHPLCGVVDFAFRTDPIPPMKLKPLSLFALVSAARLLAQNEA
jgi:hypothetical protein